MFGTALAVLTAEFRAHLDREGADPPGDLVGFRQHAIWLSREELEQLIADLRLAIIPRLANQPTPERGRHLLSPILFPWKTLLPPPTIAVARTPRRLLNWPALVKCTARSLSPVPPIRCRNPAH